ncbi:MAG: acylphosphatase [Methanotrichaceae archaeon]|nr:acylphosphatase [Methanotrichaceae archaeon]
MKLKTRIEGIKVHGVGYRVLLLDQALALDLAGFSARNKTEDGSQILLVLIEGDESQIAEFRHFVESKKPATSEVSCISFENYEGTVESLGSFAQKIYMNQLGTGIDAVLRIEKTQECMLGKQDQMLDKQDSMLEKQDSVISILEDVKEDTSAIRSCISALSKEATLEEKYERLSREIMEIKVSLLEIKAKVA